MTYPLVHQNGLWFYKYGNATDYLNEQGTPIVQCLSATGRYREHILSIMHLHMDGIPTLVKPSLYKCRTCLLVNATKRAMTAQHLTCHKTKISVTSPTASEPPTSTDLALLPTAQTSVTPSPVWIFHPGKIFILIWGL